MPEIFDNEGQVLFNVHDEEDCTPPCPIHSPSPHHMREWQLVWRQDRGFFERQCEHGIGHPDPDSLIYQSEHLGIDGAGIHGCDGCCASAKSGTIA